LETYDKESIELALSIRALLRNHKELSESDVIIFHCPLDLTLLDTIDKPSIYYNHRSGRPTTFMFNETMKHVEPIRREVLRKDREWVNKRLKELLHKPDVILSNSSSRGECSKNTLRLTLSSFIRQWTCNISNQQPSIRNGSISSRCKGWTGRKEYLSRLKLSKA
jgi:hypothetical protein